jgi:putative hemin transport protein
MNAKLKVFSTCLPQPLALCAANLGDKVLRLQDEPAAILKGLHRCGTVVLSTGNTVAAATQSAQFGHLCIGSGGQGYLSQSGSLLTLQLREWRTVFAVVAPLGHIPARSFLFFDRAGHLIQRVTVTAAGFAFEDLVCAMLHHEQHSLPLPDLAVSKNTEGSVDVNALEQDWANACDDDCFDRMLQKHGVNRLNALRLVRDSYALAVQPDSVLSLLGMAAEKGAPVSYSVANSGSLQTLLGTANALHYQRGGVLINVADSALSLKPSAIASAWRVRRRNEFGIDTTIELYDCGGNQVLQIKDGCAKHRDVPHKPSSAKGYIPKSVIPEGSRGKGKVANEDAKSAPDRWVQLLCDGLIPVRANQEMSVRSMPLLDATRLH